MKTLNAHQQAVKDIKEELSKQEKAFIMYNPKLNPVMKVLVKEQIAQQKNVVSTPIYKNEAFLIATCIPMGNKTIFKSYESKKRKKIPLRKSLYSLFKG